MLLVIMLYCNRISLYNAVGRASHSFHISYAERAALSSSSSSSSSSNSTIAGGTSSTTTKQSTIAASPLLTGVFAPVPPDSNAVATGSTSYAETVAIADNADAEEGPREKAQKKRESAATVSAMTV